MWKIVVTEGGRPAPSTQTTAANYCEFDYNYTRAVKTLIALKNKRTDDRNTDSESQSDLIFFFFHTINIRHDIAYNVDSNQRKFSCGNSNSDSK